MLKQLIKNIKHLESSSIPNLEYKNQTSIPVLQQHFIGWFEKQKI